MRITRCRLAAVAPWAVLLWTSLAALPAAGQTALREWQRIEEGGIALEHQPEHADLAREVLPVLVRELAALPPSWDVQIEQLTAQEDDVLAFLAGELGMAAPGAAMTRAFDVLSQRMRSLVLSIPDLRQLRLWTKDSLRDILKSGGTVPCFTYDAATDQVEFRMAFTDAPRGALGDRPDRYPVVLKDDTDLTVEQQIERQLQPIINVILQSPAPGVLIRETVEAGLVRDQQIAGAFRRWFTDGVAAAVTARCLERYLGEDEGAAFLEPFEGGAEPEAEDFVDLLAWRAPEFAVTLPDPPDGEDTHAHLAAALREIRALQDRHGDKALAKSLGALADYDVRDSSQILAAIRRATGEDLRPRLARYGSGNRDPFRGIAVRALRAGVAAKSAAGGETITDATRLAMSRKPDNNRGLGLTFFYVLLEPPAAMKIEFAKGGRGASAELLDTMAGQLEEPFGVVQIARDVQSGPGAPGSYWYRLYLNDRLYAELPMEIVP